ncbi:MAG: restriction endonuclease subunit S [Succinivibrio sp.]|nr:restriction endonuclease subunit S [Succinivibrio sp.]
MVETPSVNWTSISIKDVINQECRLEASVYNVEARRVRDILAKGKYPLSYICGDDGLCTAYTRGRFKRLWVNHSEFPIYQPSAIKDIYPKPDDYISAKTEVDIDSLRVHKGQILLTCSGTIGKVGLVSNTLDNQIFSHDLIRINCKNDYDIGYVYTYLMSEVGNTILCTNNYGSVISHIEAMHLDSVPIPNAPIEIKKKINELIQKSYDLRDKSNELIDEATNLLIAELHLPSKDKLLTCNNNSFSVPLSKLNYRLDSSFHLPVIDYITSFFDSNYCTVKKLSNKEVSSKIILAPRFKRVYVKKGFGQIFIGGKEITQLDPCTKKYLSNAQHKKLIDEKLKIHENMILITCSGTIGKVAFVGKHWENWTVNQHVLRVVPVSKDIAGYLAIFLQSIYGEILIKKYTYGSVIDEVDDKQIGEIPIPLPKNTVIQETINRLALQANELRYQAYCKEQDALNILNKDVLGI